MTKRERHWLEHVQAGQSYPGSMAAYARQHGLKVKDLYQWKTRLRRRGMLDTLSERKQLPAKTTGDNFVRVNVPAPRMTPALTIGVQLPNGVQLSIQGEFSDEQLCGVMNAASQLT